MSLVNSFFFKKKIETDYKLSTLLKNKNKENLAHVHGLGLEGTPMQPDISLQ
jgi:hypothetical protein